MFGFDETLHLCSLRHRKRQPRPLMLQIEGSHDMLVCFTSYQLFVFMDFAPNKTTMHCAASYWTGLFLLSML